MSAEEAAGHPYLSVTEKPTHGDVTIIRKPTLRQRLARWIAGEPPMISVVMDHAATARHYDANIAAAESIMRKETSAESVEGGARFRIIPATNGKIIGYYPMTVLRDDSLGGHVIDRNRSEQLYVLKEGDDLLGAIASCLALDRIKQE